MGRYQRAKQYLGGHDETYGGVTINIDNDNLDVPVATVGRPYTATGNNPVKSRTGPGTSYSVTGTHSPGSPVPVLCQSHGSRFGTTPVWDSFTDGTFVPDYRISTPSKTGYSAALPRCIYPYQVTAAGGVNEHTGPGVSFPTTGAAPGGVLGWVTCQRAGSRSAPLRCGTSSGTATGCRTTTWPPQARRRTPRPCHAADVAPPPGSCGPALKHGPPPMQMQILTTT